MPLLVAAEIERAGGDRRALARSAERGVLIRVHRGVYVDAADWWATGQTGRHLLRMRAMELVAQDPLRFSHWSAAVAHDLPLPKEQLGRVHCTDATAPPDRVGVCWHPLPLAEQDLEERYGLRVTGVARTVVDVAAVAAFRDAVVLADAALRMLRCEAGTARGLLVEAWQRAQARRATRKVERVLEFADGRSESVGESVSRVTMSALGAPKPVLQQKFFDLNGFIGKVDFWWPHAGVIGEFDGRLKYFDPGLTKGDPARVVYEEKRREDRLRALGVRVVRWDWSEAVDPRRLGRTLAAAGIALHSPS